MLAPIKICEKPTFYLSFLHFFLSTATVVLFLTPLYTVLCSALSLCSSGFPTLPWFHSSTYLLLLGSSTSVTKKKKSLTNEWASRRRSGFWLTL